VCLATFSSSHVDVTLHGTVILHGTRSLATNGLWTVTLPSSSSPTAPQSFAGTLQTGSPSQLVAFAHAALFSPSLSTLTKALSKNYICNFPGLSQSLLSKFPPNSVATAKGHLDQTCRNFCSTKPQSTSKPTKPPPNRPSSSAMLALPDLESDNDTFPAAAPPGLDSHHCFAAVMDSTRQFFTDQTGCFILPSSQGYTQLLIIYLYDTNFIHAEPMKSKTASAILAAYKAGHSILSAHGLNLAFNVSTTKHPLP
jgi:hypothetical protein